MNYPNQNSQGYQPPNPYADNPTVGPLNPTPYNYNQTYN